MKASLMVVILLLAPVVLHAAQSESSDAVALERLVDGAFDPRGPGGVVLVSRDGRVLLHRAYGMADVELDVPMRLDSVLLTGSVSKQFTAVAVLQLVQSGRLSLDDDIRKHVPELETHGRTVTIRQLLTHTGGVPNFVDRDDFDALSRQPHESAQLVALSRDMPMLSEPGTAFQYSDSGYIALGVLIERISGMPYGRYVRERLAAPHGLVDTRYGDDSAIVARRARGYTFEDGELRNAAHIDMSVPHAAGGIVSTAGDLMRWYRALAADEVIDRELLRQAWTPVTLADGERIGYGYGWKLCPFEGESTRGHGGFINGFTASMMHVHERGLDIVVLANQDSGRPEPSYLARRIARLLLTGNPELRTARIAPERLVQLVGTYRTPDGDLRRISQRDGVLYTQRNDRPEIALVPLSDDAFAFPDSDGTHYLEFASGTDGRIERVVTKLVCEPREVAERLPAAAAP
jgi:D-alanyl-D-alanine carboxypeptidase